MLKFGGDDVALCNACHDKEHLQGDLHPVNIPPKNDRSLQVPNEFPLYHGKITCRTCHDVYFQCAQPPDVQFNNIYFLRNGPYEKTTDLCFKCHDKNQYVKINPHKQLDTDGNMIQTQCLYCHQTLPDPDKITSTQEVDFASQSAAFCVACHGAQKQNHPANADHLLEVSPEMRSSIKKAEKRFNADLPLFQSKVFCGTCHNPHDKGVITRESAAKGADAKMKLRLDWSTDLCISCHPEKENLTARKICSPEDPDKNSRQKPECSSCHKDPLLTETTATIPSQHKSFIDKKCRACHKITRDNPEPPIVNKMCFLSGCHDTGILNNTFKHPDALQANCLLCHNQHGSQYGAHIVNDQQRLCKACHPLLSGTEPLQENAPDIDLHPYYLGLMNRLIPDRETACSYCHGEDHSTRAQTEGMTSCFRCHNYIEQLIKDKKGRTKNIHESLAQFQENECTFCHDPHSSPHPALLKNERGSYRSFR